MFMEMLGKEDAREYLERNEIPAHIAEQVLNGKAEIRDKSPWLTRQPHL